MYQQGGCLVTKAIEEVSENNMTRATWRKGTAKGSSSSISASSKYECTVYIRSKRGLADNEVVFDSKESNARDGQKSQETPKPSARNLRKLEKSLN